MDWELIMMKNTEDREHLLLCSPPAQEKQGIQSTQIHTGEQSVQTHMLIALHTITVTSVVLLHDARLKSQR